MLGWFLNIVKGKKYDKKHETSTPKVNDGVVEELKKEEDFFDPYHEETKPVGFIGKGKSEVVTAMSNAFLKAQEELDKKVEDEKNKIVEEVKEALKKSEVLVVDDDKIQPLIPRVPELADNVVSMPVDILEDPKKCANCELKKKDNCKKKLDAAIESVFQELSEMPEEELKAELDKIVEETEDEIQPDDEVTKCNPTTCEGECMGEGDCEIAIEWREKINKRTHYQNNTIIYHGGGKKKNKYKHQRRGGVKRTGIYRRI